MTTFGSLPFRCLYCGNSNTIPYISSEISSVSPCAACGLSMHESGLNMQDELAKMFDQNMSFSNHQSSRQVKDVQEAPSTRYSISQHYHHSAHITSNNTPTSESQSSTSTTPSSNRTVEILLENNIDPSCLSISQLNLFQQAESDQQSRLVELWRISPPEINNNDKCLSRDGHEGWQKTTFEQEEEMARLRYEKKNVPGNPDNHDIQMNQKNIEMESGNRPNGDSHLAEPYIKSGYELLAERDYNRQMQIGSYTVDTFSPLGSAVGSGGYHQAIDPVFRGNEGWYRYLEQEPMEHQYGMFDQMNQFGAVTHTAVGVHGKEDEEML